MSTGVYGIVRPSDVTIDDIDIFYSFSPNRETLNNIIERLNPFDVLTPLSLDEDDELYENNSDNILEGLYNLRLPAEIFNELGIYNIYIRPKTHIIEVQDCNVLSPVPSVKGLIINEQDLPEKLRENNALQGYKIEYLDNQKQKINNLVRYVVTSNKVSAVNENVGNTNQQSTRYRFNDDGTRIFLQVTPSSASDVKPNKKPFIGRTGNLIKISNTHFSPILLEIEMVDNTIDSLTNLLMGEQIKDVQNGILTYYDQDRQIRKQYNLYTIKDDVSDVPLYEVREVRDNIDESQDFDSIVDDIE